MRTYQDRVALTRNILATRIRVRIFQIENDDYVRWIHEDMPTEIYSIISCVFADQFAEYITSETEKNVKDFARRVSSYITICNRNLDSVDAFIATELDDMHVWCRDILDTMYSRIDTDNYTFVW